MEHQIYPIAIHWFIGGRIQLAADGKVNLLNNNGSEQTVFYTEP
jgi:hypothetical protein